MSQINFHKMTYTSVVMLRFIREISINDILRITFGFKAFRKVLNSIFIAVEIDVYATIKCY